MVKLEAHLFYCYQQCSLNTSWSNTYAHDYSLFQTKVHNLSVGECYFATTFRKFRLHTGHLATRDSVWISTYPRHTSLTNIQKMVITWSINQVSTYTSKKCKAKTSRKNSRKQNNPWCIQTNQSSFKTWHITRTVGHGKEKLILSKATTLYKFKACGSLRHISSQFLQ